MEFSYWISEAEYARAWRTARKGTVRILRVLTWFMLFWLFLFLFLMLLWLVSVYTSRAPMQSLQLPMSAHDLVSNVLPALLIFAIWIALLFGVAPMRLRSKYRKDPAMKGQFTVRLGPESIATSNTAGATNQSSWTAYKSWCDGKDVIVLLFRSGAYFILSLAGLTERQRQELRGILTAALPQK